MARLDHPNIVRVFGGCLTPPNLFVVAELMVGDLSDKIHSMGVESESGPALSMTLSQALLTAMDIIRGLVSWSAIDCSR